MTDTVVLFKRGEKIRVKLNGGRRPVLGTVCCDQQPMHPYVSYRDRDQREHCARLENVERL